MKEFTRYFAGLPWEIEDAIKETRKSKHCRVLEVVEMNEGNYGRKAMKVTFEVNE